MISNLINHVVIVLDSSYSMNSRRATVVTVVDNLISHLARRSKENDQETRVTVYSFSDHVNCLVWDKDVLRLPSIRDLYRIRGNTALIDATLKAIDDLSETPQRYGDHSFVIYCVTDGEENCSRNNFTTLNQRINALAENWTVAAMVPNQTGRAEAKRFGFPAGNIDVWDTTSAEGVAELGVGITRSVDNYMVARTSGSRGTKNLFSTGADAVNKQTISQAGLQQLDPTKYRLIPVHQDGIMIRDFILECGLQFKVGTAFYQLMKPEKIQANKQIAVVEKKTDKVFTGRAARDLIGLPDLEVRVKPEQNQDFHIYVQSSSVNRKLVIGTRLMVLV